MTSGSSDPNGAKGADHWEAPAVPEMLPWAAPPHPTGKWVQHEAVMCPPSSQARPSLLAICRVRLLRNLTLRRPGLGPKQAALPKYEGANPLERQQITHTLPTCLSCLICKMGVTVREPPTRSV